MPNFFADSFVPLDFPAPNSLYPSAAVEPDDGHDVPPCGFAQIKPPAAYSESVNAQVPPRTLLWRLTESLRCLEVYDISTRGARPGVSPPAYVNRLILQFPLPNTALPQVFVLQDKADDGTISSDGVYYPVHILCCTTRGEIIRLIFSTEAFFVTDDASFISYPNFSVTYSVGAIAGDAIEAGPESPVVARPMDSRGGSRGRGGGEEADDFPLLLRYPLCFSCPDTDTLLLGCDDGNVIVVRCPKGRGTKEYGDGRRYQEHPLQPTSASFIPTLLSAFGLPTTSSIRRPRLFPPSSVSVISLSTVSFGPRQHAVTISRDSSVRVFDILSRTLIQTTASLFRDPPSKVVVVPLPPFLNPSASDLAGWNTPPTVLPSVSEIATALVFGSGQVVAVGIAAKDLGEIAGIHVGSRWNGPTGEVVAASVNELSDGHIRLWAATKTGLALRELNLFERTELDADGEHETVMEGAWQYLPTKSPILASFTQSSGPVLATPSGLTLIRPADPAEVFVRGMTEFEYIRTAVGEPDPSWPPGPLQQSGFRRALVERLIPAAHVAGRLISTDTFEAFVGRWQGRFSQSISLDELAKDISSLTQGQAEVRIGLRSNDAAMVLEGVVEVLKIQSGKEAENENNAPFLLAGVGLASARVCGVEIAKAREAFARVVGFLGLLLVAGGKGGTNKTRLDNAVEELLRVWWHWRSVATVGLVQVSSVGKQPRLEQKPEGMLMDHLARSSRPPASAPFAASTLASALLLLPALRLSGPPTHPTATSLVKIAHGLVEESLFEEAERVLGAVGKCEAVDYLMARVYLGKGAWERARVSFWQAAWNRKPSHQHPFFLTCSTQHFLGHKVLFATSCTLRTCFKELGVAMLRWSSPML
ncbi:hypothetical protein M427DRAFT_476633 [Gonapodya prolifera JEL478]|uniref:Nucleoporin Nup120/160 beta-propeller domain-containing protein n=1 Tax=Gonapodya prolifera (strain JEL478) TaxID=1344416 RepID=A0A139A130_GONPJ|nr:hypothetical protein M427DRAFT_476633 [Gonapodya prolifera JEL478]|eukprot:KXS10452.1 hypothetical protein M427DRAFT_476633 [Gonapodya prolifera JEL478]